MPFLNCHFPSNTKYSVLILYARGGQLAARESIQKKSINLHGR